MNSITKSSILAASAFPLLVLAFVFPQARPSARPSVDTKAPPPAPLAGYRGWTRVNTEPHEVYSWIALLCRSATPEEIATDASNPHLGSVHDSNLLRTKFVNVFVNDLGKTAMLHQKRPAFPVGAVIVKEKLSTPKSTTPELLTIMTKRDKGYDSSHGDWEYLVMDGRGQQTQAQGKLANCQSCHSKWKATDYVSREYLSQDARRALQ